MAHKHDQVTSHYFSFDDDEIVTILAALRCHGGDELADEIQEELDDYKEAHNVDTSEIEGATQELRDLYDKYKRFCESVKVVA